MACGFSPSPRTHLPSPQPHLKTYLKGALRGALTALWLTAIPFYPHEDTYQGGRLGVGGTRDSRAQDSCPPLIPVHGPLGSGKSQVCGPFPLLTLSQKWPQCSPLEGCSLALSGLCLPALEAVSPLQRGPSVITSLAGDVLLAPGHPMAPISPSFGQL